MLIRVGTNTCKSPLPEECVMQTVFFYLVFSVPNYVSVPEDRKEKRILFSSMPTECKRNGVQIFQRKILYLGFCFLGNVSTFAALWRKWVPFLNFFLKDSCLWSLAQTPEPMQMETYEYTTDFKCTWQGNNSTQTQSKQTCCLWTHSCSVPLQQAWRICQCTDLLRRGRKRTQNLGLCYEVSTTLL